MSKDEGIGHGSVGGKQTDLWRFGIMSVIGEGGGIRRWHVLARDGKTGKGEVNSILIGYVCLYEVYLVGHMHSVIHACMETK